ncbi:ATP-dependent helicase HrpB [Thermus sediminis]|uniref:ATP-dependent helicase HrpB n=1 Tax=Thermus sediminis TaxID=1761908 RepID=UPI000E3BA176|nr:ATP-dependent helicase HrpB [Thermus sediminis]
MDWMGEAVALLKKGGRLLLKAYPGAGKSTLFPLKLLPALPGKILLFQPRRVAARAVAARLAENLGEPLGRTVGYRVRLEGREGRETRLLVMTEGLLLRLLLEDPTLEGVSAVLLDEAHERHLEGDLALALLLKVQEALRPDLKLALLTATPDGDLERALGGEVLALEGEGYPVEVFHLDRPPQGPLEPLAARYARKAFLEGEGDVLVFLPGKAEIERTRRLLEDLPTFPLHGGLPLREQAALLKPGPRKIVLATDVAETSLTLPQVRAVVDTGLAKKPRFDPRTGLTRLALVQIPEDSARQRAGRAGRTGPGRVYRLYPKGPFPPKRPEILEADLSRALLLALAFGERLEGLPLPTKPPKGALEAAWSLLRLLGAVEEEALTPLGRRMLTLPTHPRLARLALEAEEAGLLPLAADLMALLEEGLPEGEKDLMAHLEALLEARRGSPRGLAQVERTSALWRGRFGVDPLRTLPHPEAVGRLLLAAYPDRAAERLAPGRYRLATGPALRLEEGPPYLVAVGADLLEREGRVQLYAPLSREDLLERAEVALWTGWEEGRLKGYLERRLGALVLERLPVDPGPPTEAHLKEALKEGLPLPEEARQVLLRLRFLRSQGVGVPDLSEEALLENLSWLLTWTKGVRRQEDLKALPWKEILLGLLGEGRALLERLAPESVPLPGGRRKRLRYREDAPPLLSLRVQEAFGLKETPKVLEGRIPVVVELLSPAGRPVQVTQDLRSFWEKRYPEVRKELMRRYPKHPWPEEP